MTRTAMTDVRFTSEVKRKAENILKELGIPISTAHEMFYRQIIAHKGLPFDERVPPSETANAISSAQDSITRKMEEFTSIVQFLQKEKNVKFAYLFGSYATQRSGPLSDLDVAVYIDRRVNSWTYRLKLMEKLAKVLKTDKVDLVILNEAPPLLRYEVIKYGRILKDEPSRRIPFEAKVIAEYLDTARLREMHRAALAESIGKGNAFGPQRSNSRTT
jgi:uncharacterized protein